MDEKRILTDLSAIFNRISKKVKDKKPFNRTEIAILAEFSRIADMASGKPDPGPQVGVEAMTSTLGVSGVALHKWKHGSGFPMAEAETGRYNMLKVFGWLYRLKEKAEEKARAANKAAPGAAPEKTKSKALEELDAARARKLTADAIRSEMKISEEEGRLVDRQAILRSLGEHIVTASRQIQDLPHQLALFVPEAYRSRFLDEAQIKTNDLLKYLSEAEKINDEKEIETESDKN